MKSVTIAEMPFALLFPAITSLGLIVGSMAFADDGKIDPGKAKVRFEKADKALNEAWATVKAALSENEFAELKTEQKSWVEYRDDLARSPLHAGVAHDSDLPLSSPEYLETAGYLTEERTAWLKGLVRKWADKETLTGQWTDSYGGSVRIVEQKGKLLFSIECSRGPASHTGDLSGVAAWNQRIGWFNIKSETANGDDTSLSFILRDPKFEIIGANTQPYHGARAYFDGVYVKTRPLSQQEQTEVAQSAKSGESDGQ